MSLASSRGVVQSRISDRIAQGQRLVKPGQEKPFTVGEIGTRGIVLILADKWETTRSWECLEGLVPCIRARTRVEIGGAYDTKSKANTLDTYLKDCVQRTTAGWVVSLLEAAGIVNIDRPPEFPSSRTIMG